MKASQLINNLQLFVRAFGDLDVSIEIETLDKRVPRLDCGDTRLRMPAKLIQSTGESIIITHDYQLKELNDSHY